MEMDIFLQQILVFGVAAMVVIIALSRFMKAMKVSTTIASGPADLAMAAALVLGEWMLAFTLPRLALGYLDPGIAGTMRVLSIAIVVAALIDAGTYLLKKASPEGHSATDDATVVILLLAGLFVLVHVWGWRDIPDGTPRLRIARPVVGTWTVLNGGSSERLNPAFSRSDVDRFRVDMICVDPGVETLGAVVMAPVAGTVVETRNDNEQGYDPPEGNIVVIETSDGTRVKMSQLQEGSVSVAVGDQVPEGRPVARVGQSGAATRPFLRLHAWRGSQPVALILPPDGKFPIRGDRFNFGPAAMTR